MLVCVFGMCSSFEASCSEFFRNSLKTIFQNVHLCAFTSFSVLVFARQSTKYLRMGYVFESSHFCSKKGTPDMFIAKFPILLSQKRCAYIPDDGKTIAHR